MLRILIIDDAPSKVKAITDLLSEMRDINMNLVDSAVSVQDAEEKFSKVQYDLVILDLYLPLRHGMEPSPDNAIALLNDLSKEEELMMPYNIVGITRWKDADPKYKAIFDEFLLAYILYEECSDDWKLKLCNKIDFLRKAQKNLMNQEFYDYDVAIINALQTENKHVKRAFENDGWEELKVPADHSTIYYRKQICNKDKTYRIVTCSSLQMASTASAVLATKVIYNFRPKLLIMTGIAAAVNRDEVNLGDILVASKVWDGASGKIKTDNEGDDVFYPDFHEIPIDPDIHALVQKMADNRGLLDSIEAKYEGHKPAYKLNVRIGPIASVPAVLSSQGEVKKIEIHCRKLLGIEMEGYGVFYAAQNSAHPKPQYTILIKSASDFADPQKSDDFQDYCMYTSANFARHLIYLILDSPILK